LTKSNGKLGGCQFPSNRGILPFFGNVAQDQIDQLSGCFIARKMASGFEHLAQLHVQTFDRVGRVNDLSDFCPAPRFFVGTGQVQWRIISWELARGAQGNLTREEL
jgi:hypothetical protein